MSVHQLQCIYMSACLLFKFVNKQIQKFACVQAETVKAGSLFLVPGSFLFFPLGKNKKKSGKILGNKDWTPASLINPSVVCCHHKKNTVLRSDHFKPLE